MDRVPEIRRVNDVIAPRAVGRGEDALGRDARRSDTPAAEAGTRARADASASHPPGESQRAADRASRALASFGARAGAEIGARIDAVRAALRKAAASGDPDAPALLERIDRLAFRPGPEGGEALARLMGAGAPGRELALLAAAALAGVDDAAAARESFLSRWLAALGGGAVGPDGGALRSATSGVLDEWLGSSNARLEPAAAARTLRELRAELAARLSHRLGPAARGELAGALESLSSPEARASRVDGALARVLFTHGPGAKSAAAFLQAAASEGRTGGEVSGARLVLESGSGDVSQRLALGALLASLELEHAWNVARREFGDPIAWTFAVPDGGERHATVQVVGGDDERRRGAGDVAAGSFRVTVGVEFGELGPVRADIVVREGQIAVRLLAAEPGTAMAIRRHASDLESRLGLEGRQVLLAVVEGSLEQARVDAHRDGWDPADHVMDLEG